MKILHCADIHLDSRLTAHLPEETARMRRQEILRTFLDMIAWAGEQQVDAVLIAGDLFDSGRMTRTTFHAVTAAMAAEQRVTFCCLRGNHDKSLLLEEGELPGNVVLFSERWKNVRLGSGEARHPVVLTAAELVPGRESEMLKELPEVEEKDAFRIVMCHGQQAEFAPAGAKEMIDLRLLRGRGIDYLALGHVHARQEGRLDARGVWCYPGCLEGRGFDECGEHGFMLLRIDEESGKMEREFVAFARRHLHIVAADVTGCRTSAEMEDRIREGLVAEAAEPRDMVRIVLTGEIDETCEKNAEFLRQAFEDRFFYTEIRDETKIRVDYRAYRLDASLKGEYVRLLESSDLPEGKKAEVIRAGLMLLAGEEEPY